MRNKSTITISKADYYELIQQKAALAEYKTEQEKYKIEQEKHKTEQEKHKIEQEKHKIEQEKHKIEQEKYRIAQEKHRIAQEILENTVKHQKDVLLQMQITISKYRSMLFGRTSERMKFNNADQLTLFTQTQVEVAPISAPVVEAQEITEEEEDKPKDKKKHPGRLKMPSNLRRVEVILEPEGDMTHYKKVGETRTETLEQVKGYYLVKVLIRPIYEKSDEDAKIQASLPNRAIEKGKVGHTILADLLVSKYVDHLPLDRQMKIWARSGLDVPKSTVNDWTKNSIFWFEIIYNKIKQQHDNARYLMADESRIQVQDKTLKGKTHRGWYWYYYDPLSKTLLIRYQEGRGAVHPATELAQFSGYLQTDGYAAYTAAFGQNQHITLLACWAHVRRKFFEAIDTDKRNAAQMMALIAKLYAIEAELREADAGYDFRFVKRQVEAKPILTEIKNLLDQLSIISTPKSPIGNAAGYALKLWDKLIVYIESGELEIDNNPIENKVRPLAIGRKNWLFAGSHDSAQRGAIMYTIFANCQANNIDPYEYACDVLTEMPNRKQNDIDDLLPQNWKPVYSTNLEE